MADIHHELKIRAPRAKVIESLTTLGGLERWNQASVSGGDGEWAVAYPDGPTFRWKVVETSSHKIKWHCEGGPGNAKGTEVDFDLSECGESCTLVRLTHRERSKDDPNQDKCNTLWGILLGRIQQQAEQFVGANGSKPLS